MYSTMDGFLHTGLRVFTGTNITRIDLWHTDEQACLYLDEGETRVILDPGETTLVRRWSELALQATIADTEDVVIRRRCERLEQIARAQKLNRTAKRKQKTQPAATRSATARAPVIDIMEALSSKRSAAVAPAPDNAA